MVDAPKAMTVDEANARIAADTKEGYRRDAIKIGARIDMARANHPEIPPEIFYSMKNYHLDHVEEVSAKLANLRTLTPQGAPLNTDWINNETNKIYEQFGIEAKNYAKEQYKTKNLSVDEATVNKYLKAASDAVREEIPSKGLFGSLTSSIYDKEKGGMQWGGIIGGILGFLGAGLLTGGEGAGGGFMSIIMTVGIAMLGIFAGNKIFESIFPDRMSLPVDPNLGKGKTLEEGKGGNVELSQKVDAETATIVAPAGAAVVKPETKPDSAATVAAAGATVAAAGATVAAAGTAGTTPAPAAGVTGAATGTTGTTPATAPAAPLAPLAPLAGAITAECLAKKAEVTKLPPAQHVDNAIALAPATTPAPPAPETSAKVAAEKPAATKPTPITVLVALPDDVRHIFVDKNGKILIDKVDEKGRLSPDVLKDSMLMVTVNKSNGAVVHLAKADEKGNFDPQLVMDRTNIKPAFLIQFTQKFGGGIDFTTDANKQNIKTLREIADNPIYWVRKPEVQNINAGAILQPITRYDVSVTPIKDDAQDIKAGTTLTPLPYPADISVKPIGKESESQGR